MIRMLVVQAWDISYLKAIKKLLHPLHFCQIFCHLIIIPAVLFLYLFYHELRVSSDEKSLNAELLGQSKLSDPPLVFCSVVSGRKLNLNHILQHITFG
jgi:dolichyl-phosphate-mannose--protein O-mannosyl transferase